jgi:2-phosphosulfolactate phosphatase
MSAPCILELDFVAGSREARGLAVVIDVFRAFSLACYAFDRGVAAIHPVAGIDEALALRAAHPDWLLAGERNARQLPGFDFGNSPTHIAQAALAGRVLVHTTHAGTQGLANAAHADEVITGALVNAAAIVRYIERRGPEVVSLVRMGHQARERCDEDDLCAELLRARLEGRAFDTGGIRERLRRAPGAAKFFDPAADWAPERDFELCTDVDRFDFVLRLDREAAGPAALRRLDVPARFATDALGSCS